MSQDAKSKTSQPAAPALPAADSNIIASIVLNGDISKLSPEQKVHYYRQFCDRLGLDPLSQPFRILKLNGREILYCDRGGAQQLNKIHQVSHEIKAREKLDGCYVVTAQAILPDGRHTESIGAVSVDGLKGEALCNALMKAETKAKRRATLDLLGLGIMDEIEVKDIPEGEHVDAPYDISHAQGATAANATTTPAPSQTDEPNPNPFQRQYVNAQDLQAWIARAQTPKELSDLYHCNEAFIKQHNLLADFTAAKQRFALAEARYRQKYENPEDIRQLIGDAVNTKQLLDLHQNNAMIIDRTQDLHAALNERIKSLKPQSQAA